MLERELAMLEYVDFGPNPHVPKYGGCGAFQVRWAKERRALARADELRNWRSLAANPGNNLTAAHPNSPWVFRGYSPGPHIHAMSLRDRLRSRLVSTRAARLGTLHELTKLAPAA